MHDKIEIKTVPQFVKEIDGRTVSGVFSVFGNIDSYDDISEPGSFKKTFAERGSKILHLWQHDFWSPPIAKIEELREIERMELPEIVQTKYPEATGGAMVKRTYLDTPRGNEILEAIRKGVPLEMSYGYDPIRYEYEDVDGVTVRHLLEQRLWETSDVLWGANSATAASKHRGPSIPLDVLIDQIDKHLTAAQKAGARHAATDLERINTIAVYAYELGATSVKLAESDEEDEDGEKSVLSAIVQDIAKDYAETAVRVEKTSEGLIVVSVSPALMKDTNAVVIHGEDLEDEDSATTGEMAGPEMETTVKTDEDESTDADMAEAHEDVEDAVLDGDAGEEDDTDIKENRRAVEFSALTALFDDLDVLELEI